MTGLRSLGGLVVLAGLLTTRAVAQQPDTVRVTGDRVNLRTAPSTDSAIVRSLSKGTLVTILTRDNGWDQVKAPTATGWIRGNLLSASVVGSGPSQSTAAPTAPPPPPPARSVATQPPPPPPAPSRTPAITKAPSATSKPAPTTTVSSSRDGVRFTLFAGIGLNQGTVTTGESQSTIVGGFSLLFPVARMVSIGPEITGFYYSLSDTPSGDSEKSIDGAAALLIRVHSPGHVRFYGEAGPAAVSNIAVTEKFDGMSNTTTGVHLQGAVVLGAGVQFGPLIIGAHYHAHLATGGGHITYFTAGISF